ncbi:MAG: retron system putative HNH endonuclease [Isosphaeraceae bacterium]
MIRLRRPSAEDALSAKTRAYLARKAVTATTFIPGDPRIAKSWASFLGTVARRDVEAALDRYARGKCAYCENVAAKDVEHFQPKTTYPVRMFAWDNFLRGCKNCNNAKVDRFPVDEFSERLLIDPSADDPLDYFVWDTMTGMTGVNPAPGRRPRATETRRLFGLDQEPLREERRMKLKVILYLLARVVNESPVSLETRDLLREELLPNRPWLGIVRQLLRRPSPEHRPLVEAALEKLPDIREWAADWL